ncbi:MAG TPA: PRC-barrel domain-containing protein [Rhizomicrobium sp.]|nr:PRC-barrel domain-containing protein [Rhizomicrobium sp.]
MAMSEDHLKATESGNLIAASKVQGTRVVNTAGDKLGEIENVMIDKPSGKVAYAVMSFGGFLGIGDRHHPLPWGVLKYDTNLEGYVVNLDKRILEKAPNYATDDEIDWEDRDWGQRLHDYYDVPPYWR